MKGSYKKFDEDLFSKNDPKSRKIIRDFFAEFGIKLMDNINKFGVDLVSEDERTRIEVEHRHNWVDGEFPFEDVNVPERKYKFFKDGNCQYVIISKNYDYLGFICGYKLKKYMKDEFLRVSPNKFEEREYFYKIPKAEFEFVEY